MQMTAEQLVRSLRGLAHGVTDRVELRAPKRPARPRRATTADASAKEARNERRR